MLVEARVLRGEDGELHVRGERRDRNDGAPLGEELGEEGAVAGEDAGDLWGVVVPFELGDARQVGLEVTDECEDGHGGEDGEDRSGEGGPLEPYEEARAKLCPASTWTRGRGGRVEDLARRTVHASR